MRFIVNIVDKHGQITTKKHISNDGFVRMDDGETFRLLFENEWKSPGTVLYCFNAGDVYEVESIEQGEIIPSEQIFTFNKTPRGEGLLIEVMFQRHKSDVKDFRQIIAINNDYNKDGTVVNYGECDGETVTGRTVRRNDDPDLHMRVV